MDPPAQAGAIGRPDRPAGKRRGVAATSRFGCSRPGRAEAVAAIRPAAVISATPGRAAATHGVSAPSGRAGADAVGQHAGRGAGRSLAADFKDRFLAELQRQNRTFFNLHVATAQRIEIDGGRLVFTFGPVHETMRQQVDARRQWLESLAESVAGRKIGVTTARAAAADAAAARPPAGSESSTAKTAVTPDAD